MARWEPPAARARSALFLNIRSDVLELVPLTASVDFYDPVTALDALPSPLSGPLQQRETDATTDLRMVSLGVASTITAQLQLTSDNDVLIFPGSAAPLTAEILEATAAVDASTTVTELAVLGKTTRIQTLILASDLEDFRSGPSSRMTEVAVAFEVQDRNGMVTAFADAPLFDLSVSHTWTDAVSLGEPDLNSSTPAMNSSSSEEANLLATPVPDAALKRVFGPAFVSVDELRAARQADGWLAFSLDLPLEPWDGQRQLLLDFAWRACARVIYHSLLDASRGSDIPFMRRRTSRGRAHRGRTPLSHPQRGSAAHRCHD